jgi:hypothetical protein
MFSIRLIILAHFLLLNLAQKEASQSKHVNDRVDDVLAADPSEYIQWENLVKLRISDFKGSTKNKPNNAETVSFIGYTMLYNGVGNKISVQVTANFDGEQSYFKHTEKDAAILAHEQLHFDVTEIYARLFFKKLLETKLYQSGLKEQVRSILKEIDQELVEKQEQYDAQVHGNMHLQSQWNEWVAAELKKLDAYKMKLANIKVR